MTNKYGSQKLMCIVEHVVLFYNLVQAQPVVQVTNDSFTNDVELFHNNILKFLGIYLYKYIMLFCYVKCSCSVNGYSEEQRIK